jgi:hypothetical protein
LSDLKSNAIEKVFNNQVKDTEEEEYEYEYYDETDENETPSK